MKNGKFVTAQAWYKEAEEKWLKEMAKTTSRKYANKNELQLALKVLQNEIEWSTPEDDYWEPLHRIISMLESKIHWLELHPEEEGAGNEMD